MRKLPVVLLAVALTAVACGGGTDSHAMTSLGSICAGQPHELGAPLTDEGPNLLAMVRAEGDGWTWDPHLAGSLNGEFVNDEFVDDFIAIGTSDTAIAVCVTPTSTTVAAECDFEDGFTRSELSAEYDVTLRAAATGEVLDSTTASVEADGNCGMFIMVSDGDPKHEDVYPSPDEEIMEFLLPWIHGIPT
ncbi:MAG: hypothetical protein P8N02_13275 [Actinomycetota bacterium]|jgi:hypothetical protein|nr:hypothetical protein [Actinomycetota bacterium]